ncbi:MAG: M3 family metallopeptidase [Bacteroidaceae bacterium]|nr:M3 family metallopeptidase [Bacteroidaceae bacterium]
MIKENNNALFSSQGFNTQDFPHGTFPFHLVTLKDYEDAMNYGMQVEKEEMEEILSNPETPTFENTIVALEQSGDLLGEVSDVFFNLTSAETNDEMDELAEKMSPILSDHATSLCFDPRLFKRVETVYNFYHKDHPEKYEQMSVEDKRLLDDTYDGLIRSGANLDEKKKARLKEISNEMSLLDLQFSQNKLKEINAFELHITNEADLKGLPATAIDAARQTAKEKNKDGWIITLKAPSMSPFMTYSANRELRKKVWIAYNTICTHNNKHNNFETVRKIVNLSLEEAQIIGYDTYADFVLVERMAENKENVYNLLNQLIKAYKPTALKELESIKKYAKELEGEDFELQPWDVGYYSNKLQEKLYNINSEMLRPYFELSKVKEGVFGLATRLYGITFVKNNDIPVYHKDVEAFEVLDKDGTFLAVLYCDFHPRDGKKSGAWMTTYRGQYYDKDGNNVRPHVSLVMNLTRPTATNPSLLTLGEVETFLHEFGHSLHEIFSQCKYGELSGTNVYWDFVELPSQLMENFSIERDFLSTFARHYQTGEQIPDDLIQRIIDSRNFCVAMGCLRQVSFGLLDMAYYTLTKPLTTDIQEFERNAWKDAVIIPTYDEACMSVQFSHIMAGGYAAGYYSYKWAEVLDADAFDLFKQNGLFDTNTANKFRNEVLSRGATEHPMVLYKRFRGKAPSIDALLKRNGIKKVEE